MMFIATSTANFLNYLFHLYMGRALGPVDYGIMSSLFSIMYIFSAPMRTIQTVITNFVSGFNAKKEFGKIRSLFFYSFRRLFYAGFIAFLLFTLTSPKISSYLKIPSVYPIILLGVVAWLSLIQPAFDGVIYGFQKFGFLCFSINLSSFLKLIFGVGLVYLGYSVNGAISSLIFSGIIVLIILFLPIRFILKYEEKLVEHVTLYKYSLPVFYTILIISIIMNVDLILVKHYLNPVDAGYFAAASLIAKIVFFASGVLANVMFPKVSGLSKRGESTSSILTNTLVYMSIISSIILVAYFSAPTLVVSLLFGEEYDIADYIGVFGVALALFSLSNVLVTYKMALMQFDFMPFLTLCLMLEIGAIILFHGAIIDIIRILVIVNALLFAGLIRYTKF
jgi:O-antigen/teichoic acid export membrane protein